MVAYLLLDPAVVYLLPSIPKKYSVEDIIDVAEVHERCCWVESEQWLENVDQTHLVAASGKLVLQISPLTDICEWIEFDYTSNNL